MQVNYRGFEINVTREYCMAGYELLYFSVYRLSDGWEMIASFEDSAEKVRDKIKELKRDVDSYYENPGDWEDDDFI